MATVAMFKVVEPLPVIVEGVKVGVAPVGRPLTPKFTTPVKLFSAEIETE